jgi:hypothetical protein
MSHNLPDLFVCVLILNFEAKCGIISYNMEAFYVKYSLKIAEYSVVAQNGVCRVWVNHCRTSGYGVINVQCPLTGAWNVTNAHRLSYIVFNRQYNNINGLDVSHLCHNRSCVLAEHLVVEPRATNSSRTKCLLRGVCQGHGPHPNCLLQYAVNNNG